VINDHNKISKERRCQGIIHLFKLQFLPAQGGGCSAPLGAHAHVESNRLHIESGVWSLNGQKHVHCQLTAPLDTKGEDHLYEVDELSAIAIPAGHGKMEYINAYQAGMTLARQMLDEHDAKSILDDAKKEVEKMKEL
jgi:hypothetical protein